MLVKSLVYARPLYKGSKCSVFDLHSPAYEVTLLGVYADHISQLVIANPVSSGLQSFVRHEHLQTRWIRRMAFREAICGDAIKASGSLIYRLNSHGGDSVVLRCPLTTSA